MDLLGGLFGTTIGGGYGPSVSLSIPPGTFNMGGPQVQSQGQNQTQQNTSVLGKLWDFAKNDFSAGVFGSNSMIGQTGLGQTLGLGNSGGGLFQDYGLRAVLVILGLLLVAFSAWAFINKTSISIQTSK